LRRAVDNRGEQCPDQRLVHRERNDHVATALKFLAMTDCTERSEGQKSMAKAAQP
jgi:hypothetical protein